MTRRAPHHAPPLEERAARPPGYALLEDPLESALPDRPALREAACVQRLDIGRVLRDAHLAGDPPTGGTRGPGLRGSRDDRRAVGGLDSRGRRRIAAAREGLAVPQAGEDEIPRPHDPGVAHGQLEPGLDRPEDAGPDRHLHARSSVGLAHLSGGDAGGRGGVGCRPVRLGEARRVDPAPRSGGQHRVHRPVVRALPSVCEPPCHADRGRGPAAGDQDDQQDDQEGAAERGRTAARQPPPALV